MVDAARNGAQDAQGESLGSCPPGSETRAEGQTGYRVLIVEDEASVARALDAFWRHCMPPGRSAQAGRPSRQSPIRPWT